MQVIHFYFVCTFTLINQQIVIGNLQKFPYVVILNA